MTRLHAFPRVGRGGACEASGLPFINHIKDQRPPPSHNPIANSRPFARCPIGHSSVMGCFLSKVRTIADAAVKAVCDAASALWASIARAACKVVSFFFCLFILLRSVPHGCLCRCAGVRAPEEGSHRHRHLLQPQGGQDRRCCCHGCRGRVVRSCPPRLGP